MNSLLLTDSYKLDHRRQYPADTTLVFSNFTPRSDNHAADAFKGGIIVFGVQMMLKQLADHFDKNFFLKDQRFTGGPKLGFDFAIQAQENHRLKTKVMEDIKSYLNPFTQTHFDVTAFEELWDLGYLPIEVRALDEGSFCPMRVPMLTIHNTLPEFFWVTNYLETIISNLLWKPVTSATIAHAYKKILTSWATKTSPENMEFVNWQGHDFSMRGMDSVDAAIASGLGHLTSFYGTDSLPTLWGARKYYGEQQFLAGSVPATEHSVMCAGSKEGEKETFLRLLETYPTGPLSVVSDTWDFWKVLTETLPEIKNEIMARDGKLVIRPDSGDPVDIICGKICPQDNGWGDGSVQDRNYIWYDENGEYCALENYYERVKGTDEYNTSKGAVEILWDTFGGTINEEGYKVLDSHIGLIYGDSITVERAQEICRRLEAKGFATTNVVLGIGSFTYQYNTRDTFGFAMKATYIEKATVKQVGPGISIPTVEGMEIFKDPKTDSGLKKSAKGLLKVIQGENGLELVDQISWEELRAEDNLLTPVFVDGKFTKETTMTEIRNKVNQL